MQPQVVNDCLLQRTLKRIDEARSNGGCAEPVDRRAWVVVERYAFKDDHDSPHSWKLPVAAKGIRGAR